MSPKPVRSVATSAVGPTAAVALVLSLGTALVRAQSSTLSVGGEADSSAVVAVVDRYHRALSDGDSVTALALLAHDAIILESGEVETREDYRLHHLAADIAFARAVPSEPGPVRVVTRGDVAWATSTAETHGSYRGRSIDSQGAELMVATREQDGWKIRAIHWSSHALRASR